MTTLTGENPLYCKGGGERVSKWWPRETYATHLFVPNVLGTKLKQHTQIT